jgi:hypothetical protein
VGVVMGGEGSIQRRYDMRHEMLTQHALFCIAVMAKRVTLSQHFVTHVVPPLCSIIHNACSLVFGLDR